MRPVLDIPQNRFKQALKAGERQIGLWLGLTSAYCAEICACAGFDWLVLDAEHAPNDLQTLLAQLQVLAAYRSEPVVRVPSSDAAVIKQVLDLGAQTILVPAVETPEQARDLVRAIRYPPQGSRGVGTALARAARWNGIRDYLCDADEQNCLLVQIETIRGLEQLESIAAVDGVDGIFIGPADLAASLGFRGQAERLEVQNVIAEAVERVRKCNMQAGILATNQPIAERYLTLGFSFVAVGVDTLLLAKATNALADAFMTREHPVRR